MRRKYMERLIDHAEQPHSGICHEPDGETVGTARERRTRGQRARNQPGGSALRSPGLAAPPAIANNRPNTPIDSDARRAIRYSLMMIAYLTNVP